MSYALLWIEVALSSLLWSATCIAIAARSKRRLFRGAMLVAAIVPLLKLGVLAAGTGYLKFALELESNWFAYACSLLFVCLVGSVFIWSRGRSLLPASPDRAASTWPIGRLSLGLLTAVAITMMTFWNMDAEVRAKGAAMRNEAGAMMLAASPPNVSDSQNAALIYEKAFARLADDKARAALDNPATDESDLSNPALADLFKRHAITIKLLHRAATLSDCRFEHDYAHPSVAMLLPELSQARTAARLLCLHARAEKSQGHIESAIEDVNAVYHLSRSVNNEPIVISLLVSVGIDGMAGTVLEELLPAVTKSEQLSRLEIGGNFTTSHAVTRALQGEEAFGLSMLSDLTSDALAFPDMEGMLTTSDRSAVSLSWAMRPLMMLARVFLLSDEAANYRQIMERYQHDALGPYYKNPNKSQDAASIRRRGIFVAMIVPALSKVAQSSARGQATHANAELAIAMTRYRLDHGQMPATLDALMPTYIDEIPLDPFDGKPMRLAHKGDAWIIYSIGPDLKDDGGAPFDQSTKQGDITFTLKNAK